MDFIPEFVNFKLSTAFLDRISVVVPVSGNIVILHRDLFFTLQINKTVSIVNPYPNRG